MYTNTIYKLLIKGYKTGNKTETQDPPVPPTNFFKVSHLELGVTVVIGYIEKY